MRSKLFSSWIKRPILLLIGAVLLNGTLMTNSVTATVSVPVPSPLLDNQNNQENLPANTVLKALLFADMAYACSLSEEYEEAINFYKLALPVIEKEIGTESKTYANVCAQLSVCYLRTNQLQLADTFASKSLETADKCLDVDNYEYATWCNNFAYIKARLKQYSESERLYKMTLSRLGQQTAIERVASAIVEVNLGDLDAERRIRPAALKHYRHALSVIQKETSPNSPAACEIRHKISKLLNHHPKQRG